MSAKPYSGQALDCMVIWFFFFNSWLAVQQRTDALFLKIDQTTYQQFSKQKKQAKLLLVSPFLCFKNSFELWAASEDTNNWKTSPKKDSYCRLITNGYI